MTIEEKYVKCFNRFFNEFVIKGDGNKQGECVPVESISNNRMYIGDGSINIADLMQFIHVCNLNKVSVPITINQCLATLYRLENAAYKLYADRFQGIPFPHYTGFFMRDDWDNDNISMGGYAGLMHQEKEDPCHSPFVSQDQVWNLNPILMTISTSDIYSKEEQEKAATFGYNINKYIQNNNYTLYNPYLSYLVHYFKYLPNTKKSLSDRKKERENVFKPNIKVKRGANNWYYSGGTKACVEAFKTRKKTYKTCLLTVLHKGLTFVIDNIYEPILGLFGKEFKHNSLNCYAATSGIWWNKNFGDSRANKTNKWLKNKNDFYNWNTDFLIGNHDKIDWGLVKQWLENYQETNSNPIVFMCVFQWYTYHLNNMKHDI